MQFPSTKKLTSESVCQILENDWKNQLCCSIKIGQPTFEIDSGVTEDKHINRSTDQKTTVNMRGNRQNQTKTTDKEAKGD